MLWILETVTTSFRGLETSAGAVQGGYFNEIVRDLRAKQPNNMLKQALRWAETLYGYVSSPGGGGVRHGVDLKDGIELSISEARLIINLIRSYLGFLLDEHERMTRPRP